MADCQDITQYVRKLSRFYSKTFNIHLLPFLLLSCLRASCMQRAKYISFDPCCVIIFSRTLSKWNFLSLSSNGWLTVYFPATAWVQAHNEDEESRAFIPPPLPVAQRSNRAEKSRYDSCRENTPVTMRPDIDNGSRWRNYVQASSLEPPRTGHLEKVSPEWLEQHNDLNSPWLSKNKTSGEEDSSSLDDNIFQNSKKRQMWYQRIQVWIFPPSQNMTWAACRYISVEKEYGL